MWLYSDKSAWKLFLDKLDSEGIKYKDPNGYIIVSDREQASGNLPDDSSSDEENIHDS